MPIDKKKNPPKKITMDVIKKIYPIAMDVYKKRKTLKDGTEYLVKNAGMNESSAKIYIRFIVKLKNGELHRNKMRPNIFALPYFLEQIFNDSDNDSLKDTLKTLWKYIEYYEALPRGNRLVEYRKIHAEFFAKTK